MNKNLKRILKKQSGRNNQGRITVRHQGGREKRFIRKLDFKRDKRGIQARVAFLEYDPNRTANIALLVYADGEKRYILAPADLRIGDKLMSGPKAEVKAGNALPLSKIPVGTMVHNIEIKPGRGGQLVRGAGGSAIIQAKDKISVTLKLPSGERRLVSRDCFATIGQVGKAEWKTEIVGKAGRKRHWGIRPTVRGKAQDPDSHPHGGGEGRSGIGMPSPKSPWGKPVRGNKTRKRQKYSDKYILEGRK